jgi:hypothetical protein
LRLLAQLAGVKPSAIAAALNNPEYLDAHLTSEQLARFADAESRLVDFITRTNTYLTPHIDAVTEKIRKKKGLA